MRNNHYTMVARNAIKEALKTVDSKANIGIGCSGGADSMALLVALATLYTKERAKQVHVIIVDHRLQEVTKEVAERTARVAKNFGFNAHIATVEVPETQYGAEADARTARYDAFQRAIDFHDLQAFMTAHTKNDQAEQVFLGLLRGSGTRSLAGIPEQRGVFIRPFVNTLSREGTQQVCIENKMSYWNDPHNKSLKYKRVAIRKLIDDTERYAQQDIVEPLSRTAQISSEDAEALDMYAAIAYSNLEAQDWSIDALKNVPKAVRKRTYRMKILELGARTDSVTFDLTNRVDDLVVNYNGQGAISFSEGITVSRKGKALHFVK